jgi:hypothetical protein
VPLGWQTIGPGEVHFINGTDSTGTITGGILNEDFTFTSSLAGSHVITGFDPVHDLIGLSLAQFTNFTDLAPYETNSNGSVMLNLGNGSTLTLQGVSAASLSAKNFTFS